MENKKQDYLSTLFQNAHTGMQAIHDVIPKVQNKRLEEILSQQYDDYQKIADRLKEYGKKECLEVKDNNWFEKARMFISTKMSTLFDDSTRNIVTMFLLGTTMGLVQLLKDHTDYNGVDSELDNIRSELEELQQENYNQLRDFLKEQ